MSAEQELANAIANAVEVKLDNLRSESSTMPATYQGKDAQGKDWVLLPGAVSPTPVSRMAVEAVPGDIVSVTISNGKATVDSNVSNPSAGVAGVKIVERTANVAKTTAENAIDYASAAQSAALAAQSSANNAYKHADEASQEAANAKASAIAAQSDADIANRAASAAVADAAIANQAASDAQDSADNALKSAKAAAYGLSEVENVVGTLNWIAQHGSYVLTGDTTPVEGRLYYTLEGGTYAPTSDTDISSHKQYYELVEGEYVPVISPDVSEISSYFERSGMAITKVDNPSAGDMSTYFEAWVGDSVQNYIASHLWLDDYGLNLTVDTSTGYVLHEGTVDGTRPMGMYILQSDGTVVSAFSENVQIGAESGAHVEIQGNRLSFLVGDAEVAYVAIDTDTNESVFYMTKAIIVQDLRFAKWQWRARANDNLSLKWMGGE